MTTTAADAHRAAPSTIPWPAIALGALAAGSTMPVVGILWSVVFGLLMGPIALLYAPFVVVVATIVGVPVVLVVGAPSAALGWIMLRPVRAEWVHVLLFGVLGAMLMVVLSTGSALMFGAGSGPGLLLHGGLVVGACLTPFAIVPAVVGRIVLGAYARRDEPGLPPSVDARIVPA